LSQKSTFSNATSKSYALALFDLAKENSELEKVEEETNALMSLLKQGSDFREMISNPAIGKKEKQNVIFGIAEKYNFCQTHRKFLGFLTFKNRLFFLSQIIERFLDFVSKNKGELKAKLFSSKNLTKQELEKIQKELSKDFQTSIKIDYKYDPDLIAGLVIQVGSLMVDTSVKSKIKQLEKNMIEA